MMRRTWLVARREIAHNLTRPMFWVWFILFAFTVWGLANGNLRIAISGDSVGRRQEAVDHQRVFLCAVADGDEPAVERVLRGDRGGAVRDSRRGTQGPSLAAFHAR